MGKWNQPKNVPNVPGNTPPIKQREKSNSISDLCISVQSYINVLISNKLTQDIVEKELIKCFRKGLVDDAIMIKNNFGIDDKRIYYKTIKDSVENCLIKCLNTLKMDDIVKIKNNFYISNDFIKSDKVQYLAKKKIIYCLKNGYIDDIDQIKCNFDVQDEFIKSYETQMIAKRCIIHFLKMNQIEVAIKIKELFNIKINNDDICKIYDVAINFAAEGHIDRFIYTQNNFKL